MRADTPELKQECMKAVDLLIARYGWQLLEREEYIRHTIAHFRAGVASDARRAATYTYSYALYIACSGVEGKERQELGYTELFRYLYDSASRRYPNICDDATQRALECSFTAFGRCREPGAFLAFALQHLADAARVLHRQEQQAPMSLAMPIGEQQSTLGEVLPDTQQADLTLELIADEHRYRFFECVREFQRNHPRARQQLAALWLKYIEDLDDVAISQRLGKPIQSIYVLRSRIIAKLRAEPSWRALALEFGITLN